MRESKMRNVDFTLDELADMAKLTRKQFTDRLSRVCELYNIDKGDFKAYPDEEDSIYFLPPDIAEYLLLLVKNIEKHPMYKRTAKSENVHATQVSEFNRAILKDIDETVSLPIKEIIYNRMGHLVSERIAYWGEPMVKHLTRFLINLATMETEDIGAALSMFTKEIDKMNYHVFRGNYLKRFAYSENMKVFTTEPLTEEEQEYNHLLNDSNVSIDTIISALLKSAIPSAHYIRDHRFYSPLESMYETCGLYKMIGLRDNKAENAIEEFRKLGNNPTVEDERKVYYEYFVRNSDCESRYEYNKYIIDHQREQQVKWKPINVRIADGEYFEPIEVTVEETKKFIEKEIKRHEEEIMRLRNKLEELEGKSDSEKNTFAKEVQDAYKEYCENIDEKYIVLHEITDKFVGQALNKFLS